MAGVYIHIPFCEQFCTYCNFYSVKGGAYRDKFIQALKKEIEIKSDFLKGASTIYFGGGTPSVLSIPQLEGIISILNINNTQEITLEVNPDDITADYALGLVVIGFNRVSMGVQSFVDEHLEWMNRRHRATQAVMAYHMLRSAGVKNISLDLIFGYANLTMEQWQYNLERVIELAPDHISAYQMSVEPGSALSAKLRRGEYSLPEDSLCVEQYKMLQQILTTSGYEQYEVSNFSKKGFRSQHNSSYWDKTTYFGLGPAAHSFDGKMRFWNTESVKKYCDYYLNDVAVAQDNPLETPISMSEVLLEKDIFNESIMLGLRTAQGVNTIALNSNLFISISHIIKHQAAIGNLIIDGSFIKIPTDKLFVSDSIIRELFLD